MHPIEAALYARVSTDQQTRGQTIVSQVAALRERVAVDGLVLDPEHVFVDDGVSGTSLLRPALERLRDAVAMGGLDRLYVQSPDRLARRYAYQVLLVEEFRRAGTEIVFLNRPIGVSPEDDLLLQLQGMIAEYERAKILERSRRGRRHAAQMGAVSALVSGTVRLSLCAQERGRRDRPDRDRARAGALRAAHVRLGRIGPPQPARGLSEAAGRGRADGHRPGRLGPDQHRAHGAQSGVSRPGHVRAAAQRSATGQAPLAPPPGPELAAKLVQCRHAAGAMDRHSGPGDRRSRGLRGCPSPAR